MPLSQHSLAHVAESDSELEIDWLERYREVRRATEAICAPMAVEDYVVQSMPDVSPPKWHIAHVSWFFEAFILIPYLSGYKAMNPAYDHLFNSYYETHSKPFSRPDRGKLSRPTVEDIYRYRHHVDAAMERLLGTADGCGKLAKPGELYQRLRLGLNHEQQHQELLLMDIQHILAQNPLAPAYRAALAPPDSGEGAALRWLSYPSGLRCIGHDRSSPAFAFDNETPRHPEYVAGFSLANRPVSNGEYLQFMADGGYDRPELWLSDGWNLARQEEWEAPLYWEREGDNWHQRTLGGSRPVVLDAPVCHVSFYEADAFARWAGARLPTEAEWEMAAQNLPPEGNLLETDLLTPAPATKGSNQLQQMFGDVWEWTGSAYRPYPGFKALAGSLGEYNGKFMSGQMVLKGGCCATPQNHIRASYRNFFPPHARWAFSGFRLAKEE